MSYSAEQFSNYLGIERSTFHTWIRKGLINKSTKSSMCGRKGGPETKLWGDAYVMSLGPKTMRAEGKKVQRKRLDKVSTSETFELVLSTSSALAQKGKRCLQN